MSNKTRWQGTALLLALSLALGACSDPGPGVTPPGPGPGNALPAAPTGLSAATTPEAVTLSWQANTEGDLAGYRVSRGTSAGGPFTLLTPQPITGTTFRDTGVSPGATYVYQVVAVNRAGGASPAATVSATVGQANTASLQLQNLDAVPGSDRLVFSRIGPLANPPGNRVHDGVTLRLNNPGDRDVRVTGLPVTGPWTVTPAPTGSAPLTVPAGGSLDLTVRFTAEGPGNVTNHLHEGKLTVVWDGGSAAVTLAGLWQSLSESGVEPNVDEIRRAFGYTFNFVDPGTPVGDSQVIPALDRYGEVAPNGDEVIAPYWQRADAARPVTVTQLAAYHTQGNRATLAWYAKGGRSAQNVVTSDGASAQSVLPNGQGGAGLAAGSFAPPGTFGLVVDNQEWSDPTYNAHGPDLRAGCKGPCGQHLRFWPVRDSAGQPVPNTYFMVMDYAGINYDYNDNLYLISNLRPAPVLMNVGGPTFTAPSGEVWTADNYAYTDQSGTYTYYSPGNAIPQPNSPTSVAIAGTDNPELYRTYRHNTLDTPLDRRVMTYDIPLNDGTYQVKLHFAELFWDSAGKRVFDVNVEGVSIRQNFDIFAQAGGKNRALVLPVNDVKVQGGKLTVVLRTVVDHTNISGIEVSR
ncbi:malectin domain-containing carbohydrate-binding protein [Deinococcus aestuarii]|uniref:malectin domain-containing carbohydrate-binding protein n=1 Tax=Deinococcus aestuarii TaxID=2774531 RepID=UPI001C0BABA3|nr:malectin domain-containing carbohydrate-binding protein [Deinococcus aestuarii]